MKDATVPIWRMEVSPERNVHNYKQGNRANNGEVFCVHGYIDDENGGDWLSLKDGITYCIWVGSYSQKTGDGGVNINQ